jgi:hypothetical protein
MRSAQSCVACEILDLIRESTSKRYWMISKWKKNAKKPSFSRALSLKLPIFECKCESQKHLKEDELSLRAFFCEAVSYLAIGRLLHPAKTAGFAMTRYLWMCNILLTSTVFECKVENLFHQILKNSVFTTESCIKPSRLDYINKHESISNAITVLRQPLERFVDDLPVRQEIWNQGCHFLQKG